MDKNQLLKEERMAAAAAASCQICDSKYLGDNSRKYRNITCLFCGFDACNSCCEKYILSQPGEAQCMSPPCKQLWPRKFIARHFSDTFLNKIYKEHRENYLVEKERAKMPATQIYAESVQRLDKMRADRNKKIAEMQELKTRIIHISRDISRIERYVTQPNAAARLGDIVAAAAAAEMRESAGGGGGASSRAIIAEEDNEVEGYRFMHRCPANDCRGFVSTAWKCGLCNKYSCSKCHEIKDEDEEGEAEAEAEAEEAAAGGEENEGRRRRRVHVCNPDTVLTVSLIKKDTKQCPKCHRYIHRIEGCDQMFCVVCCTAFSYRTGCIETKHIHNPHWFEWQRKNSPNGEIPRQPGDVPGGGGGGGPCGGGGYGRDAEITHQTATSIITVFNVRHSNPFANEKVDVEMDSQITFCRDAVSRFIRHFLHYKFVTIRSILEPNLTEVEERESLQLRVRYLLSKISDNELKSDLQRKDKCRQKTRELRDIYEMYIAATTDIVFRFLDHLRTCPAREINYGMLDEYIELVGYANQNIAEICAIYKSKPLLIPIPLDFYKK